MCREKKILLYLEYDGTNFHGYQRQKDQRTVQGDLEGALRTLLKEEVVLSGSSRTDTGVHARAYPVSFVTRSTIPGDRMIHALNPHLPEDVKVQRSLEVPMDFDARKSAQGKTYSYRILRRKAPSALYRHYAYHYPRTLHVEKILAAKEAFLGTHDFSGFRSMGSTDPNPVKTLSSIEVLEEGDFLVFYFTASGFLYNMARILAGTLLDAGIGRMDAQGIQEILASGKRGTSMVLPPGGLYLEEVYYDPQVFQVPMGEVLCKP